jgi:hypothetical protein
MKKTIIITMAFLLGLTGTALAGKNERVLKKIVKSDETIQDARIYYDAKIVVFKGNFPDKVSDDIVVQTWCGKFNKKIEFIQLRQMEGDIVGRGWCQ